jgi:hypothetical protein
VSWEKLFIFKDVRFETVTMKNAAFWGVASCRYFVNWFSLQPPAHAGSPFEDFSTLKMETIHFSETSVYIISTRDYIPEDGILYFQRCFLFLILWLKIVLLNLPQYTFTCPAEFLLLTEVARMGEKKNTYRILVGKPEGKRPLGRTRH